MSKVKEIVRYILAVILAVSITIFLVVNIATTTVLDKNFILSKLDETSYYEKINGYVKEKFENYIQQSGFSENILDNIITEEQVKADTQKVITNIYNNINEEISADELKNKLKENIRKETLGIIVTTEQQQSIDNFVNDICNEYLLCIAHFDFEKDIYNTFSQASKTIEIANKASLITIAIAIVILIIISLRRIYKVFVFLGISCVSSGLFFILANSYINSKIKIQTITILNESLSFTLRNILETIMNMIKNNGINLILVGVILIVLFNLIHNIIKYKDE